MTNFDRFIDSTLSETTNCEMLLSLVDLLDMSMSIFDKDGVLLGLNKHAMSTYGIKDIDAFLKLKPNFFECISLKSSLDARKLATQNVTLRTFFDNDKFNKLYPGIGYKTGRVLCLLKIRPIYDENGNMKYILTFPEVLSKLKKDRATRDKLKDTLPMMINAQGMSTWAYDIESGRRILDSGPHLFPDCVTIDDFLAIVNEFDSLLLKNLIFLIKTGKKMEGNVVIRLKDDNTHNGQIYLDVFCVPQFENDEVKGIFFLTQDITYIKNNELKLIAKDKKIASDRDKMRSSNLLLTSVINRIPCLFYAKDADKEFQYTMANSIFCDLMGKDISQIIGHTDSEVLPEGFNLEEIHISDVTALLKGSLTYRFESNCDGKKTMWSSLKYSVETPDGKRLVICLARDVSDVNNAYEKAKESEMAAKRADKMKSVFLQNIGNELITPLNSVIGFSQLLLEPSTDEEREQYEREINQNGKLLKSIIDEITELSKIEAGMAVSNKETFDLCEYLEKMKSKYEYQLNSDVEFRVKTPCKKCVVSIDKSHLGRIINRGLLNAIGYAFRGYIELGFECEEGGVKLYIEDTGVGLSDDEIVSVRDHYENVNGFSESIAFSLSLCRMYAKMLGGTIDFSSTKAGVSKVWISIPTSVSLL